jgi:hypothetical protein
MAEVSAETVLEAAVVSTAELSFLLHPASANAAMASVATLYSDPVLNIVLLPPFMVVKKAAPFAAASFLFAGVSGKKRTHHPMWFRIRVFCCNFLFASGKLAVGHSSITRPQSCVPILSSSPRSYQQW